MTSDLIHTKPLRQTFVVADLKCYLCGTVSGSIEREQTATAPARRGRRRSCCVGPASRSRCSLQDWRRLRCDRCGGPLFLDETDVIVRRTEDYNWSEERPRRGRPPKRLVEQRQRERELLDPQAA